MQDQIDDAINDAVMKVQTRMPTPHALPANQQSTSATPARRSTRGGNKDNQLK